MKRSLTESRKHKFLKSLREVMRIQKEAEALNLRAIGILEMEVEIEFEHFPVDQEIKDIYEAVCAEVCIDREVELVASEVYGLFRPKWMTEQAQ